MAVLPTPEIVTVDTPHGPVRVRDTGGAGPPVLLVHAVLVDGDLYARLVPLLTARGLRCLVPELPLGAHALPLRPDADLTPPGIAALLVSVLDAVQVERAHVVGNDTGGALAQLLMAHHRDRVDRAVLIGCDAYEAFPPRPIGPLFAPLRVPAGAWAVAQLARLPVVRRLANLRPLTHVGTDDATLLRWTIPLRDARVRRDLRKFLAGVDSRHTLAAAAANADFPRPVLIAWGDDDRVFPRSLATRLAADLPHAELVTLADCAVFAALDQPERLAELITSHLGRETGQRDAPGRPPEGDHVHLGRTVGGGN